MIIEADAVWSFIFQHFRLRAPTARDRRIGGPEMRAGSKNALYGLSFSS